jgi:hypothetical protein
MKTQTWFEKVKSFFAKIFSEAPQWTVTASTAVKLALPLASTIVKLIVGSAEGTEAVNIGNEVVSDLGVVGTLLANAHAAPDAGTVSQITAALNSVSSGLDALLKGGHIKNADTLANVETSANLVIGEVEAIMSVLPQPIAA